MTIKKKSYVTWVAPRLHNIPYMVPNIHHAMAFKNESKIKSKEITQNEQRMK